MATEGEEHNKIREGKPGAGKLPGNHGQFGVDAATEEHKTLQSPAEPEASAQAEITRTAAGERS